MSILKNILIYFTITTICLLILKQEKSEIINNCTISYPSIFKSYSKIFITKKNTTQIGILEKIKNSFIKSWKEKKWESFSVFVYPCLIIGFTLFFTLVLAPSIQIPFMNLLIITLSIIIFSILWSQIVMHTKAKKYACATYFPKIIALIAIIVCSFIFPCQIMILLSIAYYITSFITSSTKILGAQGKAKTLLYIMLFLYTTNLVIKIINLASPFSLFILLGFCLFTIITIVIYVLLYKYRYKHFIKSLFYLLQIPLIFILGDSANAIRSLCSIMTTSNDTIGYLVETGKNKETKNRLYKNFPIDVKIYTKVFMAS